MTACSFIYKCKQREDMKKESDAHTSDAHKSDGS